MMKREVPMSKICKLCGKKILGDILDHFSEKHFSFYVANKETIMAQGGLSVAGRCRCLTKDSNTSIEKEGYIPYPLQA